MTAPPVCFKLYGITLRLQLLCRVLRSHTSAQTLHPKLHPCCLLPARLTLHVPMRPTHSSTHCRSVPLVNSSVMKLMVWLPASCHLPAAQQVQEGRQSAAASANACWFELCADGQDGVDNRAPPPAATVAVAAPSRCARSPLVACDDVSVVQGPQHTDLCSQPVSQSARTGGPAPKHTSTSTRTNTTV